MKIQLASIFVNDQPRAREVYTKILGFQIKRDLTIGDHSWLSVVSPENPEGTELMLDPIRDELSQDFQASRYRDGIPAISFAVADVRAEYSKLQARGMHFTQEPTKSLGPVTATFDDTCGNLVQIYRG